MGAIVIFCALLCVHRSMKDVALEKGEKLESFFTLKLVYWFFLMHGIYGFLFYVKLDILVALVTRYPYFYLGRLYGQFF